MNKKYLGLLTIGSVAIALAASTSSLTPTGAGTYNAWTPSTGSTHYTLVDESSCNGTTDYVSTSVAGNRDSYTLSLGTIPDGSTITSISITPCASKTTSNKAASMSVFYRANGVDSADGAAYTLSGNTPVSLTATNFTGLSITKTSSTSLEVGAVLASGATTGARLSRLATVITYSPTLPSDPTSLTVSLGTSTNPVLSWSDTANNESMFLIERSTDGINFSQIASTTANVTSYTNFGLSSGTYYYQVRAYNETGFSGYTNTASITVP